MRSFWGQLFKHAGNYVTFSAKAGRRYGLSVGRHAQARRRSRSHSINLVDQHIRKLAAYQAYLVSWNEMNPASAYRRRLPPSSKTRRSRLKITPLRYRIFLCWALKATGARLPAGQAILQTYRGIPRGVIKRRVLSRRRLAPKMPISHA